MNEEKVTTVNLPVFQAIPRIMLEMEPIAKAKRNTIQNFNFRGIDDIYNNLQGLMAKYGVFSVPVVLESSTEERTTKNGGLNLFRILKIQYDFYGSDGSKFSAIVQGEGADMGDKASNKAMAIAHKYALMQVFAIPTEDIDPDANTIDPMVENGSGKNETEKQLKEKEATIYYKKVKTWLSSATPTLDALKGTKEKWVASDKLFEETGKQEQYDEILKALNEKIKALQPEPQDQGLIKSELDRAIAEETT